MKNSASFLIPEPPDDFAEAEALLINRVNEMDQAVSQVRSVLQAKSSVKRPMAFVGAARTGKSHLLACVAHRVASEIDCMAVVRISTGLTTPHDILREMFAQVAASLYNATLERGMGPEEEGPGVLDPLDQIMTDYSEAIAGYGTEIEVSRALSNVQGLRSSSSLGLKLPMLALHLAPAQQTRTETETRRVKVNRFEVSTLSELIMLAHDLVRQSDPNWTTMLVLDDFDLLRRNQEGKFDPEPLLQTLAALARVEGLLVLTTVREDTYARHPKAFHLLLRVQPFVNDQDLLAIYRRHVERYHDEEEPFNRDFVNEVACRCEGRVGVFMSHLRESYITFGPQIGEITFRQYVEKGWEPFVHLEPQLAEAVSLAALNEGGLIGQERLRDLRGSALMRFVLEDYTSENCARVDPLLLSYLRERGGKPR